MASSGNFSTWNPLVKGTENVSSGNCKLDMTTGNRGALGNFEIPLTGKWYFEGYIKMASNLEGVIGVSDAEVDLQSSRGGKNDSNTEALNFSQYTGSSYFAIKIDSGSEDAGGRINLGSNDNAVIGVAVNRDDNELKLYANNTLRFTLTLSATTKYFPWCGVGGGNNSSAFVYLNAGQDSTFGGNKTAGGNADGNGFGDFFYSVPSNHLALCSANLPISADIDPAQTDDDIPTKQFGAYTYTGSNGSAVTVSTDFQADLIWIKSRSSTDNNYLQDSSRGFGNSKSLSSNSTGVEGFNGGAPSSSGAQNVGSSSFQAYGSDWSRDTDNMIAWCWRANGGTTASNTDGDVTSTVQSNTKAGFSIVQYVGNRSSAGTSTVGHGLGGVPDMFITKPTSHSGRWYVWHTGLSGASYMLELNSNSAQQNKSANGSMSLPTSTVFDITYTEGLGESGETHIGYFWRSIEGYSKFGKFEGNSNDDGPFIYTGFRPRMLWIKEIDTADDWVVYDTARSTFNPVQKVLRYESNTSEFDGTSRAIDMLSNGFKIRTSNNTINQSNTFVYGCFGDVPFKYNNTF